MASRLERIGSIYSRLKGLLRNGVIFEVDKPIWLDIYTHFPPEREPTFANPVDPKEIRQIFYSEDKVRALIHTELQEQLEYMNLNSDQPETNSEKFIKMYTQFLSEGASEDEALKKLKASLNLDKFERTPLRDDNSYKPKKTN